MAETPEARKAGEAAERAPKVQGVADQAGREARVVSERATDASKRTAEALADVTRQATEQTEDAVKLGQGLANQAAREARAAAEKGADIAKRTAEAAAEATRRVGEQTEGAVKFGARVMAGVQDAGIDQSRRMLDVTARMTGAYREAADRTADDVNALISSWDNYGRGVQRWQQTWVDLFQQSIDLFARRRQDLLRCRSAVEFAGVQRDIYIDLVRHMLNTGTSLLQLTAQVAQVSAEPLQQRARPGVRA